MIWLTWRQYRIEAIVGGVLLILAIGFLLTNTLSTPDVHQQVGLVTTTTLLLSMFPLLIGIFLGAPMVAREVEQKTHQFIWTQGITSTGWLLRKAGIIAGTIILAALLLGLTARIWGSSVNIWWSFDLQFPVLVAYSLYALVAGIAVSGLIRRTVAAIALTVPAFLLPRLAIVELRAFFLSPLTYTWDANQADPRAGFGDWKISEGLIDHNRQTVSQDYAHQLCEPAAPSGLSNKLTSLNQCWQDHGFLYQTTYHPATQFWLFQGIEATIFLVLAAVLLYATIWLLKHRTN